MASVIAFVARGLSRQPFFFVVIPNAFAFCQRQRSVRSYLAVNWHLWYLADQKANSTLTSVGTAVCRISIAGDVFSNGVEFPMFAFSSD